MGTFWIVNKYCMQFIIQHLIWTCLLNYIRAEIRFRQRAGSCEPLSAHSDKTPDDSPSHPLGIWGVRQVFFIHFVSQYRPSHTWNFGLEYLSKLFAKLNFLIRSMSSIDSNLIVSLQFLWNIWSRAGQYYDKSWILNWSSWQSTFQWNCQIGI